MAAESKWEAQQELEHSLSLPVSPQSDLRSPAVKMAHLYLVLNDGRQ